MKPLNMELTSQELGFIKSILSTEDNRKLFLEIFDKLISELKDIETIENVTTEELKIRLEAVKKLREIIRRLVVIASGEEENKYYAI